MLLERLPFNARSEPRVYHAGAQVGVVEDFSDQMNVVPALREPTANSAPQIMQPDIFNAGSMPRDRAGTYFCRSRLSYL
jgi:hypothetical protein